MRVWSSFLKPLIRKTKIQKPVYAALRYVESRRLKAQSHEDLFSDIYKSNKWNGVESVSGQGSDLFETEHLLSMLPSFLKKYDIQSIIDLPCGDYNWMQHLHYDFDRYVGVDIVQDIIEKNNVQFASDTKSFVKKDCLHDDLGAADMILCRDLLIHFSHEDVVQFFRNLKKSQIKYILTTHFIDEKNGSIATGQWNPINLCAHPYNFPKPIESIIEQTKMFEGKYSKTKTMSLWFVANIPDLD